MQKEMHSAHFWDLKDTEDVCFWETQNVNLTFVYLQENSTRQL